MLATEEQNNQPVPLLIHWIFIVIFLNHFPGNAYGCVSVSVRFIWILSSHCNCHSCKLLVCPRWAIRIVLSTCSANSTDFCHLHKAGAWVLSECLAQSVEKMKKKSWIYLVDCEQLMTWGFNTAAALILGWTLNVSDNFFTCIQVS